MVNIDDTKNLLRF